MLVNLYIFKAVRNRSAKMHEIYFSVTAFREIKYSYLLSVLILSLQLYCERHPLQLISQTHFKQNCIYVVRKGIGKHIHYVNGLLLAVYQDNVHSFPVMWLPVFLCLPKTKTVGFSQSNKLLSNVEQ